MEYKTIKAIEKVGEVVKSILAASPDMHGSIRHNFKNGAYVNSNIEYTVIPKKDEVLDGN